MTTPKSIQLPSPLQKISHPIFSEYQLNVFIKRDDLIHPDISGNKWRKLKWNILEAKKQDKKSILTFGGAFSNHIIATAVAGNLLNIKTIGFIRGEKTDKLNPTLTKAQENGMELHFISRATYSKKNDPFYLSELQNQFPNSFIVPEGGGNKLGTKGCSEIIDEINIPFDYIATACGTSATLAGLAQNLSHKQQAIGFSVLKGEGSLSAFCSDLIQDASKNNWQINNDYHFGGYAKYNPELVQFINDFKSLTNIQLDPIYNGKMVYGVIDLIKKNYFKPNSTVILLHTGGLQGITGFNQRYKKKELLVNSEKHSS